MNGSLRKALPYFPAYKCFIQALAVYTGLSFTTSKAKWELYIYLSPASTTNNNTFRLQCICVFRINLRMNSYYFPKQL